MYRVVVLLFGLVLAGAAQPSFGQDAETCVRPEKVSEDVRIASCTKLIEAAQFDAKTLALARFRRGEAWMAKGDLARADADYTESLRLDPLNIAVYMNRGVLRARRGDDADAVADYTEAVRLDPTDTGASKRRGYAWDRLSEHARAVADYSQALAIDAQDASTFRRRAYSQFFLRDYPLAAADFQEALSFDPTEPYAVIWGYLSDVRVFGASSAASTLRKRWDDLDHRTWPAPAVLFMLGKLGIDDLRLAARQDDPGKQPYRTCELSFYLGHWNLIGGRAAEARALFQQAQAVCPKGSIVHLGAVAALRPEDAATAVPDPATAAARRGCTAAGAMPDDRVAACSRAIGAGQIDLYRIRGQVFAAKGQWDRAIDDFVEALRRDPENADLYAERGDAWHAKGDTQKAMADYNASLHLRFDAGVYGRRGRQWLARGAYSTAIDDFTKGIALDPGNAILFSGRAQVWEKKGDPEKARADYDQSVRLGSDDSTVYRNRALFLLKQGDPDGAIVDLNETIRRNPADSSAFVQRGLVLARMGDFARPFVDFDEAVRLDAKDGHAYYSRGIAAFFLGRFAAAAADFAEAQSQELGGFHQKSPLAPAWRYLALARGGSLDAALSSVRLAAYAPTWEYGLLEFLAGQHSEGWLLQEARDSYDPVRQAMTYCQYDFFVGQRRVLDAKYTDARASFRTAVDTCPKGMLEYAAALAELRRLGPE